MALLSFFFFNPCDHQFELQILKRADATVPMKGNLNLSVMASLDL